MTATPSPQPRVRLVVELVVALAGGSLLFWTSRIDLRWLELHATPAFCFDASTQLSRARLTRALVVAVGATLIVVVRPIAGRWAGRRTPRALLADVARLLVVPIGLALVACEVILRLWPSPPGPHFEPDSERDTRLSWRPVPAHVTDLRVCGRMVRFAVDAEDERVRALEAPVDPTRPTILFTGESVASGFGLPYEETYPAMVAARLGVQAVNVAVQGYANDASYLRLVDALPRFAHVLATVTLVVPSALYRNMAPDRPHLRFSSDGSVQMVARTDHDWSLWSVETLFERTIGLHSAEAALRAHDTMAATARATRARGALPLAIVFGWPTCLPDDGDAPSIDRTLFEGVDLPHTHVDVPKDAWDPVTGHPDVRAQTKIAEAIVQTLRASGVTP